MSAKDQIFRRDKTVDKLAVPPFLFRVASANGSRRLNTEDDIDPLFGYDAEYHASLDELSKDKRGIMIHHHVAYDYYSPSEFSSWSVSLWFILVHARRKSHKKYENRTLIYVMDTSKLPSKRIYHAVQLLRDHNQHRATFLETKVTMEMLAQGEYMIHGKLETSDGLWQAVQLEELEDRGLWDCFPGLCNRNKDHLLHWRTEEMRWCVFRHSFRITDDIFDRLKLLAQCFGPHWEGVMLTGLLTMYSRDFDPTSMAALTARLGDFRIPKLPFSTDSSLRGMHLVWPELGEWRQFMQLLRLLHDAHEEP